MMVTISHKWSNYTQWLMVKFLMLVKHCNTGEEITQLFPTLTMKKSNKSVREMLSMIVPSLFLLWPGTLSFHYSSFTYDVVVFSRDLT